MAGVRDRRRCGVTREGRRGGILAMLLGLALLGGCRPTHPGEAVATTLRSPEQQALHAQMERHERLGLADPRGHLRQLQTLLARAPTPDCLRVELLSLQSPLLALLRDRLGHDTLQRELEPLQQQPATRSCAALALRLNKAYWLKENGELSAAARSLGEPQGDPSALLWRAQMLLAKVQVDVGEVQAAVNAGLQALELAQRLGSVWREAAATSAQAYTYLIAEQTPLAKQNAAEAVELAQRDPDPVLLYTVNNVQGIVHSQDQDPGLTLQCLTRALDYTREAQAQRLEALALGNLADFHLRRANYPRALELASEGLSLARASNDTLSEILALHNRGIAKIALKRVEEGKRDVLQAITMDTQREAGSYTAESWLELGRYLETAGDLAGAVDAYHRSRLQFDGLLRDETRKAVLEAQARYEDQQHQREIRLLNQDNSLKAEQIRSRDLQLKLWAELGGCVLLSAALLSLAYRRIRRTNQALAQANESLRVQSERDPLTGLANRRHFQAQVARQGDAQGLRGSLFLIDIDHFKRINDQWGHAAGDSVLVEVAQRLRSVLREQDLVVRWGGEEFLILIKSQDTEDARLLAQRLLDRIGATPASHGPLAVPVTASIGFASFPMAPHDTALDWERAIDLVDTVMYMAKAHGRNKAYGIARMSAHGREDLLALQGRLEAAWQAGQVQLLALQGPAQESRP